MCKTTHYVVPIVEYLNAIILIYSKNPDIITSVCNTSVVFICVTKISALIVYKMEFLQLIMFMKEHFWEVDYNHEEKQIVDNVRKTCTYFTTLVTFSAQCTLASNVGTPIIENLGRNITERLLPYNMWIDFPLWATPYFEIMFTLQVLGMYMISVAYFSVDNILCLMTVHTSGQFRILQYRLTKLGDIEEQTKDEDTRLTNYSYDCYEKFKSCVKYHQILIDFCEKIENVFSVIALVQVLSFSLLICLYGHETFLADKSISRRIVFFFFLVGSIHMLFMFSYTCNGLIEESGNVALAAYSAPWPYTPMNKTGRMLRNDLMTVILRSRKPCCLTAYGFFPVSLKTCTTVR
ncbi:odorant receptor 4-like [Ptiloglossa arizonensis]|uniref:odorant receptor 4-like n=1 Tax=Ptiloglossa arizonensis TaxID=3350558 RepID=UPI003F9F1111